VSAAHRVALAATLRVLLSVARAVESDPLAWISWLPVQLAFLQDTSPEKMLRAGNQVGKTTAALAEVHFQCSGKHPYRKLRRRPPIEAWIICASWSQSLAVQKKFFRIARRDLINGSRCHPINGFHANNPTAIYKNGSVVRFKTANQNTIDLSAATIHLVLFDEPPDPGVFAEVQERVKRTEGDVLWAMTPVGRPVEYVRERVERGLISEHHTRLSPEALVPVGETEPLKTELGTPMDAEWIAKQELKYLPMEREIRMHGGWEMRTGERTFDNFDQGEHVVELEELPPGEWEFHLGLDHGLKQFKEVALLVAVEPPREPSDPYRVVVLDEYCGQAGTSVRADALAIHQMLERNGLTWGELTSVWGDRVHLGGSADKKANKDLQREIARLQRPPVPALSLSPPIWTVKRGRGANKGSVLAGCRWLYQVLATPGGFAIDARCEHTIKALDTWELGDDNEHKDKIDALRYSLQKFIFGHAGAGRWRQKVSKKVRFR
jgi:phage terminase large subunit-like protein